MAPTKRRLARRVELEGAVSMRLGAFLRERTLDRFLAARDAMLLSRAYDPKSTVLPDVYRLLGRGLYHQVLAVATESMANWILNPGIHFVASQAFRELGDVERADAEAEMGRALLGGLLMTGDGSPEHPYLVLRAADEYDVLASMGLRCRAHQVAYRNGRAYDALACDDGRDVWFDVSAAAGVGLRPGVAA
ncbi:MAG TPA: DUF4919 domain-containing protein [Candidatus Eisenbacteria bacterium]|nr:DUF4919 domain-containing protein [Candidatus Eisenbacteria bacterium]